MATLPKKLKHDAILEALLELRFDQLPVPEVFFGRLADYGPWQKFMQRRLPAADIPAPMQRADPNLRFQPTFELHDPLTRRAIRVGPQVLSYHQTSPYVGWERFRPELLDVAKQLFAKASDVTVRRLGLRYLNAMTEARHRIHTIGDLNMGVRVHDETIAQALNVNFNNALTDDTTCTVRVSTTEFVQGDLPHDTVAFIDVDVYTNEGYRSNELAVVEKWIDFAHDEEKKAFFRLLKPETIEHLREE